MSAESLNPSLICKLIPVRLSSVTSFSLSSVTF